jgi:hypothetical protein
MTTMRFLMAVVIGIALIVAWGFSGRHLTLLLDRVGTIGSRALPVNPIQYDGGGLRIGGLNMTFAGTDNLQSGIGCTTDSANRAVLVKGSTRFTLGPRLNAIDDSGRPDIDIVPEGGDEVAFTVSHSPVSSPTWFEFKILGGRSPWWQRYVYYRLRWKKSSGAVLDMRWRYQQGNYSETGWTEPLMMWNSQTGLVGFEVR